MRRRRQRAGGRRRRRAAAAAAGPASRRSQPWPPPPGPWPSPRHPVPATDEGGRKETAAAAATAATGVPSLSVRLTSAPGGVSLPPPARGKVRRERRRLILWLRRRPRRQERCGRAGCEVVHTGASLGLAETPPHPGALPMGGTGTPWPLWAAPPWRGGVPGVTP